MPSMGKEKRGKNVFEDFETSSWSGAIMKEALSANDKQPSSRKTSHWTPNSILEEASEIDYLET